MPNTYTQIHIHVVFAVKYRSSVIDNSFEKRLYNYIIAIICRNGHKVLAIGGTGDHIHILIGLRPTEALSSLMNEVKRDSSLWINAHHLTKCYFQWQRGYGAFSVSKSHVDRVVKYILNQKTHHSEKLFGEEYVEILRRSDIPFDEKYLFRSLE